MDKLVVQKTGTAFNSHSKFHTDAHKKFFIYPSERTRYRISEIAETIGLFDKKGPFSKAGTWPKEL